MSFVDLIRASHRALLEGRESDACTLLHQAQEHDHCEGDAADLLDLADSALEQDMFELADDHLQRAVFAAQTLD